MNDEATRKFSEINSLYHSIRLVMNAADKRAERDLLAKEALAKLTQIYGQLDKDQLEAKWRETEGLAQTFREAFYSGEDGYRNTRIIDLVWEGARNNKVNVDRDHVDNMTYTGGHIMALEEAGITPDQYMAKLVELREQCNKLKQQA